MTVKERKKYRKERYWKNPEKYRAESRMYKRANPDIVKVARAREKANRKANPEKYREMDKKYNLRQREHRRAAYKENPEKYLAVSRIWAKKHPDFFREWNLKRSYGITLKDYQKILRKQKGLCAICKRPPTGTRKLVNGIVKTQILEVDHDHETNEIRGLLCMPCNRDLVGANTLATAIAVVRYLKKKKVIIK